MIPVKLRPFTERTAHVAVIGLGYVGLPLAVTLAQAGYRVTGIDLDRRKVAALNQGQSYLEDVPTATIADLVFGQAGAVLNQAAVVAFGEIMSNQP